MRYIEDIQVESVIVHITDPPRKNNPHARGLVLSERSLPLVDNEELISYFSKHIVHALQDSSTMAAKFESFASEQASSICKALLNQETDLVPGSKFLAQKLYDIIEEDQRRSTGTLVAVLFRDSNNLKDRYLALLKIDPSRAFRPITTRDSRGIPYVALQAESEMLPTTREKLQKCAFIRSLDPRPNDFDMMLLDRQAETVAQFFRRDFLGATLALDSRERTRILYKVLTSTHNIIRNLLSPIESDRLDQFIQLVVTSKSIDIDNALDGLNLPDTHKKQINEAVLGKLQDRKFDIDQTFAKRYLVKKRRFRGDHGLKIDVSADSFDKIIQSIEWLKTPAPAHYRIVIRTEKWNEVT